MKNKKRGQGLVEYVMLLLIPLLVIAVIPNINKTLKMTLTSVGVDLLEQMGDVEAVEECPPTGCIPPDTIYPPTALFELPENCGITGIYQKGRPIRLANASFDMDGDIDHLQWWITKYDATGAKNTDCTTPPGNPIVVNRTDISNFSRGLTISATGYGFRNKYGVGDEAEGYANCMRDPGRFVVTLRVIDNDGLVSQAYTEEFEVRDVRPSIVVSAIVSSPAIGQKGDHDSKITQKRVSDACKFSPTDGLRDGDTEIEIENEASGYEQVTGVVEFDDHEYYYIETCPYIEGIYSGKVTFVVNNPDVDSTYADPDFAAIEGVSEFTFEGELRPEKRRYGFEYETRYISSVETIDREDTGIDEIDPDTVQITKFTTGATSYSKQFKTAGTYLYDATVTDENKVMASDESPSVGVAVRVLSKNDPDYATKCPDQCEGDDCGAPEECPKPQYMFGIEKLKTNSTGTGEDVYGPIYTSVGVFGKDKSGANITPDKITYQHFMVNSVDIDGTDTNIPSNRFSSVLYNAANPSKSLYGQAADILEMEVYGTKRKVFDNKQQVEIPVFRPKAGERVIIHALAYYGDSNGVVTDACLPDGNTPSYFWSSSNETYGIRNNFNYSNLSIETGTDKSYIWKNSGEWSEINRPYQIDASKRTYYSSKDIADTDTFESYWNTSSYPIYNPANTSQLFHTKNAEILFGMARNYYGASEFGANENKLPADPFNSQTPALNNAREPSAGFTKHKEPEGQPPISGYYRSNGQILLLAPEELSCPTFAEKPIPKLSVKAKKVLDDGTLAAEYEDVPLMEDIFVEITTSGYGKFKVKNPKLDEYGRAKLDDSGNVEYEAEQYYGFECESNGCFVQVSSINSKCGVNAQQDCTIEGIRWKFDRNVTSKQKQPTIVQGASNDPNYVYYPHVATAQDKYTHVYYGAKSSGNYPANTLGDKNDTIWKLPMNSKTNQFLSYGDYDALNDLYYTKLVNELKAENPGISAANLNTLLANSASSDRFWNVTKVDKAPTTNSLSRFDWDASNETGTAVMAPNAIKLYNSSDVNSSIAPGLFENKNKVSGYFIEAVDKDDPGDKAYTYEIEVIDSQGCATSTSKSITVYKNTDEPVAYCNFIYQYVIGEEDLAMIPEDADDWNDQMNELTFEKIRKYQYYGGKMIQDATTMFSTDGESLHKSYVLPLIIENGNDILEEEEYLNRKVQRQPRVSPIFLFNASPALSGLNAFSNDVSDASHVKYKDNGAQVYQNLARGDDTKAFQLATDGSWSDSEAEAFYDWFNKGEKSEYSPEDYNPKTAQLLTGENLSDFLNASGSYVGDLENKLEKTGTSNVEALWTIYETTNSISDLNSYMTSPGSNQFSYAGLQQALEESETSGIELVQQHIKGYQTTNLIGTKFKKGTKVCECRTKLEEGPTCCNGKLNKAGYYVAELKVINLNVPDDATHKAQRESKPIDCKIKVKMPTLDFKCPWGETFTELQNNRINLQVDKETGELLSLPEDMLSYTTESFIGNKKITHLEVTPFLHNDPFVINTSTNERLDSVEKDKYDQILLEFKKDTISGDNAYFEAAVNNIEAETKYINPCSGSGCTSSIRNRFMYGMYGAPSINDFGILYNGQVTIQPFDMRIVDNRFTNFVTTYSNNNNLTISETEKKSLPLELLLTKYFLYILNTEGTNWASESDMTPAKEKSMAHTAYLKTVVASKLENGIYHPAHVAFVLDDTTYALDANKLEYALFSLSDYYPNISLIIDYIKEISEIIALKDNKNNITWGELQPQLISKSSGLRDTTAINKFYENVVRENKLSSIPDSLVWGTENNNKRSVFYGKYIATKRFQNTSIYELNSLLKGQTLDSGLFQDLDDAIDFLKTQKISPIKLNAQIVADKINSENNFTKYKESANQYIDLSRQYMYYDYRTIGNDNFNFITDYSGNFVTHSTPTNKFTIQNGDELRTKNTNYYFVDTPEKTLEMSSALRKGAITANEILNYVSFKKDTTTRSIFLVRVNSFDETSPNDKIAVKVNGSTKYFSNNYSKLCPVVVEKVTPGIANVACNLKTIDTTASDPDTGNQMYYGKKFKDTSYVTEDYISLDPYRVIGTYMPRFTHSGTAAVPSMPIMDMEQTRKMVESALYDGAKTMTYKLDILSYDKSTVLKTKTINIDLSSLNKYDLSDGELQAKVLNPFNAEIQVSSFMSSVNNTELSIDETSKLLHFWGASTTAFSSCAEGSLGDTGNLTWQEVLNSPTDIGQSGTTELDVWQPNICKLMFKVPSTTPVYEIFPLQYNISFKDGNGALMDVDADETPQYKTCTMYSAQQYKIKEPVTDPIYARIEIYSVNYRIQHLNQDKLVHADSSYNPNYSSGSANYTKGIYPSGTTCVWKLQSHSRNYSKVSRSATGITPKDTILDGAYQANPSVSTSLNMCAPRYNGEMRQTYVDLRSTDNSSTGFVTQQLLIRQGDNQVCHTDSPSTTYNGKSYCGKSTLYAVTKSAGCGNVKILGNLTASDVYLILQANNGGYSKIIHQNVLGNYDTSQLCVDSTYNEQQTAKRILGN